MTAFPPICDHPQDVLTFLAEAAERSEKTALITVTNTFGGGVRSIGAIMAASEDGRSAGYISNGCVDADVIANAQAVIASGEPKKLLYGQGSPFLDIRLPCGGAIELLVTPAPSREALTTCLKRLRNRQAARLQILPHGIVRALPASTKPSGWNGTSFEIACTPKLRIRIAGSGTEALAFTRLALASGFELELLSPDLECIDNAKLSGVEATQHLTKPSALKAGEEDPWTAFVMLFHDHDWDSELIARALAGPAFYIGALGSKRTHAARCEALKARGIASEEIARVHGPVGLVPALRDASTLAISALAEIVSVYQESQAA